MYHYLRRKPTFSFGEKRHFYYTNYRVCNDEIQKCKSKQEKCVYDKTTSAGCVVRTLIYSTLLVCTIFAIVALTYFGGLAEDEFVALSLLPLCFFICYFVVSIKYCKNEMSVYSLMVFTGIFISFFFLNVLSLLCFLKYANYNILERYGYSVFSRVLLPVNNFPFHFFDFDWNSIIIETWILATIFTFIPNLILVIGSFCKYSKQRKIVKDIEKQYNDFEDEIFGLNNEMSEYQLEYTETVEKCKVLFCEAKEKNDLSKIQELADYYFDEARKWMENYRKEKRLKWKDQIHQHYLDALNKNPVDVDSIKEAAKFGDEDAEKWLENQEKRKNYDSFLEAKSKNDHETIKFIADNYHISEACLYIADSMLMQDFELFTKKEKKQICENAISYLDYCEEEDPNVVFLYAVYDLMELSLDLDGWKETLTQLKNAKNNKLLDEKYQKCINDYIKQIIAIIDNEEEQAEKKKSSHSSYGFCDYCSSPSTTVTDVRGYVDSMNFAWWSTENESKIANDPNLTSEQKEEARIYLRNYYD